jgi:hypothetical protein
MGATLSFGLLENAIDFVLSAGEHARRDTPRDLKYATLHLTAGVELLLKARLQEEHWSLLFADTSQADRAKLTLGDFKSVTLDQALIRLRGIAGVEVSPGHRADIEHLQRLRNMIQHFQVSATAEDVRSRLARGLNFVLAFIGDNLSDAVDDEDLGNLHEDLREFQAFVKERLQSIQTELGVAARLVRCPRCWQVTLEVGAGEPNCLFCSYECTIADLAAQRSEWEVRECPECGLMSCAIILLGNEDATWYCVACGASFDRTPCTRCDTGLAKSGDLFCGACWRAVTDD